MTKGKAIDQELEQWVLEHLYAHELTPSYHGKECLGNGEWPGYECMCDECDHYLTCFPDWRDLMLRPLNAEGCA